MGQERKRAARERRDGKSRRKVGSGADRRADDARRDDGVTAGSSQQQDPSEQEPADEVSSQSEPEPSVQQQPLQNDLMIFTPAGSMDRLDGLDRTTGNGEERTVDVDRSMSACDAQVQSSEPGPQLSTGPSIDNVPLSSLLSEPQSSPGRGQGAQQFHALQQQACLRSTYTAHPTAPPDVPAAAQGTAAEAMHGFMTQQIAQGTGGSARVQHNALHAGGQMLGRHLPPPPQLQRNWRLPPKDRPEPRTCGRHFASHGSSSAAQLMPVPATRATFPSTQGRLHDCSSSADLGNPSQQPSNGTPNSPGPSMMTNRLSEPDGQLVGQGGPTNSSFSCSWRIPAIHDGCAYQTLPDHLAVQVSQGSGGSCARASTSASLTARKRLLLMLQSLVQASIRAPLRLAYLARDVMAWLRLRRSTPRQDAPVASWQGSPLQAGGAMMGEGADLATQAGACVPFSSEVGRGCEEAEERVRELRWQVEQMAEQLKGAQARVAELGSQMEQAERRQREHEQQQGQLRDQLRKKDSDLDGERRKAADQAAAVARVRQELKAKEADLAAMERRARAAEQQCGTLRKAMDDAQSQAAASRRRLQEHKEAHETELALLDERSYDAMRVNEELEGQLQDCKEELRVLREDLAAAGRDGAHVAGSGGAAVNGVAPAVVSESHAGPGAAAVSALRRVLGTGGLEVGYGMQEVQVELEQLLQRLQHLAALPFWSELAVLDWTKGLLQQQGLWLGCWDDAGVARTLVHGLLLACLNDRVFGSWTEWSSTLLGCPALLGTPHVLGSRGGLELDPQSTLVCESAQLILTSKACRAWLRAGGSVPPALLQSLTNRVLEDAHRAMLFCHGPLPREVPPALSLCVLAALRLWAMLKAAHPLLKPALSSPGSTAATGAVIYRQVHCSLLNGHWAGQQAGQALVLSSLCPAAVYASPCAGAGEACEVLVPEKVAVAKVVPLAAGQAPAVLGQGASKEEAPAGVDAMEDDDIYAC